jgi:two-component system, OmpR family, phosphate regulon sensor histidine kinase PhoR
MLWRFVSFISSQLVVGALGWYVAPASNQAFGVVAGVVLGSSIWFAVDFARGVKLLEWLRAGDVSDGVMAHGLWGEVSDRTRRLVRSRERQTLESQNRLNDFLAALQASPNGVVLLDAQGRIEWFNQTATEHFGFEPQRDLLQHFGNLVRDPGFAAYFAGNDYQDGVMMPGRTSTASRPVTLAVHLHPYGDGRSLLLSRDITAVEQAEAMRRDFVANVSHEVRTPLTVLGGFVETLQTLQLDESDRQRYLALMAQQADRMQTLVKDLLTLSRIEGSPLPGLDERVSVSTLMQQVESEARALSGLVNQSPGVAQTLSFSCTSGRELLGVSSELLSAMSNLVGNAIRYTPADGEVQVICRNDSEGRLVFSVQDTGPGIAPEHIPRLTERFYRVDRSRSRETGGTGLGLAIVKHVVQRHGAELKIDSTPGQGSTFTIVFPANRVSVVQSTMKIA